MNISYSPAGPIIKEFHESSDFFFRGIMGPVGSGKSSSCAVELLRMAAAQRVCKDGKKRFRAAIIRNSYPELKTTTIKTWQMWCPPSFGRITMDPPIQQIIHTDKIELEILFLALDREEDQRKLLSLELTYAWLNECREISKVVLDALTGRVGRYPPKMFFEEDLPHEKGKPKDDFYGILADTNPPDDQHWWYDLAENDTPKNWKFLRQPSGLSPKAENIANLPTSYYQNIMTGKTDDWIKVYVYGEYGMVTEGRPVFPQYRDTVHCVDEVIEPHPHFNLVIAADFGLSAAAVIGQLLGDGQLLILDEFTTENVGTIHFAITLSQYISMNYPDHEVHDPCWGDPAGAHRTATAKDEQSHLDIMNEHSAFHWRPAPGANLISERLEAVRLILNRMIDGKPAIKISARCKKLRKGFVSGYHYKFVGRNGGKIQETPNKNEYSHIHDACQYLVLGIGGADAVLNKKNKQARRSGPIVARGIGSGPRGW